jgi:hypothetical protein
MPALAVTVPKRVVEELIGHIEMVALYLAEEHQQPVLDVDLGIGR